MVLRQGIPVKTSLSPADYAEINPVLFNLIDQNGTESLLNFDSNVRVLCGEFPDDLSEKLIIGRICSTYVNFSDIQAHDGLCLLCVQFTETGKFGYDRKKLLTFFGRRDTAAASVEQRKAGFCFQGSHHAAHSGRRVSQLLCGIREISDADGAEQGGAFICIHVISFCIYLVLDCVFVKVKLRLCRFTQ